MNSKLLNYHVNRIATPLSLLMSFFMQKAGNENFADIYKLNSLLLILRTLLSNSRIQ